MHAIRTGPRVSGVIVALAVSRMIYAQPPIPTVVSSTVACAGCRIELTRIAILGATTGPGALPGLPSSAARDSRGRVFLTFVDGAGSLPLVFDSTGSFVGAIGRRGPGPGEMAHPALVAVAPDDSIIVFDEARALVFTRQLVYVREMRLPAMPLSAAVLRSGTLIVQGGSDEPQRSGYLLHAVSSTGNVHSFAPRPGSAPAAGSPRYEQVSPTARNTFWSADIRDYVLTEWLPTGEIRRVLRRDAEWFERFGASGGGPVSLVTSVRQDGEGRLWTTSRIKSDQWRQHMPGARPGGESVAAETPWDKLYDGMIEVLDPATGRLLASRRVPGYLSGMIDERHLITYIEDADGNPRVTVWRVQLVQPREPTR